MKVLAKDWLKPEEDKAWEDLWRGMRQMPILSMFYGIIVRMYKKENSKHKIEPLK